MPDRQTVHNNRFFSRQKQKSQSPVAFVAAANTFSATRGSTDVDFGGPSLLSPEVE